MSGSLLPQKGQLRLDSVLPATPHIPDALSLVTKAGVRNASHALSAILQRVADNVGVKIGTASIPVLAFVSGKNITLSANDEPANAVLAKLFEQLSPGPVPDSWHLFYEPG